MNAESSLVAAGDPFAQMRVAQERITKIRADLADWLELPALHKSTFVPTDPADIHWLCDRIERTLAVMQDGQSAWGYVDTMTDPPTAGPMMVLRDALAEALGGN